MALSRSFANTRNVLCFSFHHVLHSSQSSKVLLQRPFCRPSAWLQYHSKSPNKIVIRSFRTKRETARITQAESPAKEESFHVFKSVAYVTGVCSCSFLTAMIWNYENMRKSFNRMKEKRSSPAGSSSKRRDMDLRQHLEMLRTQLTIVGLIAANACVYLLWNVPRLQDRMVKYFASAAGRPLVSMTLSSFSHISFIHLFINMYVLVSFLPPTIKLYGHEQLSAFYISAGTVSAFTSVLVNHLLKRRNLMSVGASGAIMGILGVIGVNFPEAKLQIAFISDIFPHSFSASNGVKAIIAFDLIGLFMGWRVLDHAGHLGGVLFGILYAKYGKSAIWGKARERIVKIWHEIRGKP